jgi:hypothetical protein
MLVGRAWMRWWPAWSPPTTTQAWHSGRPAQTVQNSFKKKKTNERRQPINSAQQWSACDSCGEELVFVEPTARHGPIKATQRGASAGSPTLHPASHATTKQLQADPHPNRQSEYRVRPKLTQIDPYKPAPPTHSNPPKSRSASPDSAPPPWRTFCRTGRCCLRISSSP